MAKKKKGRRGPRRKYYSVAGGLLFATTVDKIAEKILGRSIFGGTLNELTNGIGGALPAKTQDGKILQAGAATILVNEASSSMTKTRLPLTKRHGLKP